MTRFLRRTLLVITAIFLAGLPGVPSALAVGVGVFPQEIVVDGGLRGGEHLQTLGVINDADEVRAISFVAEGAAADWITVSDPDDPERLLDRIQATAEAREFVTVRIAIPDDAANGVYTAVLQVVSTPLDGGDDTTVGIGVSVPITIVVSGTQVLAGSIADFAAADSEVGVPAQWSITIRNEGNVALDPELELEVSDDAGRSLAVLTQTAPSIPPGASADIAGAWETTDVAPGGYVATLRARARGTALGVTDARFVVFPRGHFTRRVELQQLVLANEPSPGGVAIVTVVFANVGEIDARAVFVGEFIRNGQRLETIESLERLIAPGETGSIDVYVDIPAEGTYTLIGRARYAEAESDARDVSFRVGSPPKSFATRWGWWIMGGGSLLVLAALLLIVLVRRRRLATYLPRRRPGHPRIR